MSMFTKHDILINSQAGSWRFKIQSKKLKISKSKNFANVLKSKHQIFAFVYVGVTTTNKKINQKFHISKQMKNYKELFDNEKVEMLFEQHGEGHVIDLMKDKESSFIPLYNLTQNKLAKFRRYIDDVLTKEWIKHSVSSTRVSILFVFKKDEELRLCVDYRSLNVVIVKNRHSLSLITKTLNRLNDSKRFIKFDFKNVYHRIRIKRDDEWKTTFRTRYEHFEYQIMSFELTNASAIFQTYINKTLKRLVNNICVIYLNDILIYNENSAEHWWHVQMILKRLRQFQLFVNLKKCQFDIKKIEFLKFIVFTDEIRMNSKRVRTINEWFKSKIYKEIQVFLNFVNFYKHFIYRYSAIAASLINLLKDSKKDKKSNLYHWGEETKQTFQQFRNIFSFASLLIHFDLKKKIKMKTNASNFVVTDILN